MSVQVQSLPPLLRSNIFDQSHQTYFPRDHAGIIPSPPKLESASTNYTAPSRKPKTKPNAGKIPAGDVFITYTHPNQRNDKQNRRKIFSYIGTHYRNRSRPATRTQLANNPNKSIEPSRRLMPIPQDDVEIHPNFSRNSPLAQLYRDNSGLRSDPFESYPIEATRCVGGAVDYCTYHPPSQSTNSLLTQISPQLLRTHPYHSTRFGRRGGKLCTDPKLFQVRSIQCCVIRSNHRPLADSLDIEPMGIQRQRKRLLAGSKIRSRCIVSLWESPCEVEGFGD
jgi:hypothetical protein